MEESEHVVELVIYRLSNQLGSGAILDHAVYVAYTHLQPLDEPLLLHRTFFHGRLSILVLIYHNLLIDFLYLRPLCFPLSETVNYT